VKTAARSSQAPSGVPGPQNGRHFVPQAAPGEPSAPDEVVLPAVLADVADVANGNAALVEVIGSAVHPLEIAASLETCGLSNAVVRQRFGHQDVFGLAEDLYDGVRFRAAAVPDQPKPRLGGLPELGRGTVFAAPTLMFAGAAIAFRSWLPVWTIPLALVCGWGFSQLVAYTGLSREASGLAPDATVAWALLAALSSATLIGLAC
jgi:hypothetical protein